MLREQLSRRRGERSVGRPAGPDRPARGRRVAGVAAATIGSAVLMLGGGATSAVAADNCANAEFRVGLSALLPDCRAYELVSPADKDNYTLVMNFPAFPSVKGNEATFGTITPFASPRNGNLARYVAVRTSDGWTAANIMPEYCRSDQSGQDLFVLQSFSKDLRTAIVEAPATSNCDPNDHAGRDLYRAEADGSLTWLSHNGAPKTVDVVPRLSGLSADGSRTIFATTERLVLPLEAGRTIGGGLYERHGHDVRVVGLKTNGSLINGCGAVPAGDDSAPGRVSDDGRVIFFNSGSSASVAGCSPSNDDGGQLYARLDGTRTILLSTSHLSSPEARQQPTFMGATDDGRKAFFVSPERLTAEATVGGGLYEYDMGPVLDGASIGTLRFLSPSLDGNPASIVGRHVVGLSEGGTVVYFVANGVLAPGVPSGQKIYRAESGRVEFVGTFAGSAFTPSGDASVSPDGSKLAFQHRPPGASVNQIHLYDAGAPGALTCVSCPSGGAPPSGAPRFDASSLNRRPAALGASRYVTNDGRVFFTSPDRLAARDSNTKLDVYEYGDGERHLISSGSSEYDSILVGSTGSGRDIFFVTNDSLLPKDFDNGDQDMYVARVGGGFPQPTSEADVCVGDACQGAAKAAPGLLIPGTGGYVGAGNIPVAPAEKGNETSPKVTLVKDSRSVRGTSGRVRVRVSGKGKVRTSGSGLRRSTRSVSRSGTAYQVPVRLSARAKRTLNRRGRVQVRVTVRFTPDEGKSRSKRVRMTFRKAKGPSSRSMTRAKSIKTTSKASERTVFVGSAPDQKGGR